jgi:hypothetical protein
LDNTEVGPVRLSSALSLVDVTNGEVDDVVVVEIIAAGNEDGDGEDALLKIAEHGKTKAVRAAAQGHLEPLDLEKLEKKGLLVTEAEVADEARQQWWHNHGLLLVVSLVYYPLSMVLWGFMYRDSLRRKRVTVRSLLILLVLVAIGVFGLPLLLAKL